MEPWMFKEKSYKKILGRLIEESQTGRGMVSRVAEAIGCQRSYLSQVLHSKVQLTKEQAWNACVFFGLSREETAYFECLVDHERAASPVYKRHLEGRMDEIREEVKQLTKSSGKYGKGTDAGSLYYFSYWLPCAVHILSSIPEFQEPAQMAERLGLPLPVIRQTLSELQGMGLVKQEKTKWVFDSSSKWIPKESPLSKFHQQDWRQLAVDNARQPHAVGMHYTIVQSLSRADFEKLQQLLRDYLEQVNKISGPSEPEILTCLNLDFFEPRRSWG